MQKMSKSLLSIIYWAAIPMIQLVRDIYPKNIPATIQKDLTKKNPELSYRQTRS